MGQGPVAVQDQSNDQVNQRAQGAAANPRRKVPRGGEFALTFGGKEGAKKGVNVATNMSLAPVAPHHPSPGGEVHRAGL